MRQRRPKRHRDKLDKQSSHHKAGQLWRKKKVGEGEAMEREGRSTREEAQNCHSPGFVALMDHLTVCDAQRTACDFNCRYNLTQQECVDAQNYAASAAQCFEAAVHHRRQIEQQKQQQHYQAQQASATPAPAVKIYRYMERERLEVYHKHLVPTAADFWKALRRPSSSHLPRDDRKRGFTKSKSGKAGCTEAKLPAM
ncbi:hypothetical protein LTR85_005394 [Meristemomyces frigidus]|nr:hypothetical protein LTR85_005394 [Meristemomyces frigidus]